jgi:hypothetical protein
VGKAGGMAMSNESVHLQCCIRRQRASEVTEEVIDFSVYRQRSYDGQCQGFDGGPWPGEVEAEDQKVASGTFGPSTVDET